MRTQLLAAGASIHWNGIHGWLIFLAAVAFLLAALASIGKAGRLSGLAIFFISAGLLLWSLSGLVSG